MIAIIDYNVGNLFSVKNALDYIGLASEITRDAKTIEQADEMIIPGVGAFPDAMHELKKTGLVPAIRKEAVKKPLLGICLGMQILFDKGYEFEECDGLGLIPGEVKLIPVTDRKIPHMGWNELIFTNPCPLLKSVPERSYVYFVHSYMADTDEKNIAASVDYGVKIPALVQNGNVYGAQFHPEKSGDLGLEMLRTFGKLV